MKATPIPQRSRDLVRSRERQRCARCAVPAPNGHWHHRRRRNIRDAHTHCPCNGVWLCGHCHIPWAHGNPTEAKAEGFILPTWVAEPWTVGFRTPIGIVLPDCHGGFSLGT